MRVRPHDSSSSLTLLALLAVVGVACGPNGGTQISQSGAGASQAILAQTADGLAVAWNDTRDGNPEIYVRLLNAMGEPAGPERRLTNSPEASQHLDLELTATDNLALAWHEDAGGRTQAKLGVWSPDGTPRWSTTLSSAEHGGRNPIVRRDGNGLMAIWIEDLPAGLANSKERPWEAEVWASWWNGEGKQLRVPRMLAPAGKTTARVRAALDGRGWAWVMYDARSGTKSDELFVARTNGSTAELAVLTADDGMPSKNPDISFSTGGRVAVTWHDARDGNEEVYLFAGRMAEFVEERAFRVTETDGHSTGSHLAWNGRRIGVAWSDDSDGEPAIYFRGFNESGEPLSRATQLTGGDPASNVPSIRAAGSGFGIAWHESTPGGSEIAFTSVR